MRALQPLKSVATLLVSNVDKKTVEGEVGVWLCNYVDVYYNDHITNSLPFMEATASAEQIATFGLRQGDVLFTKDSETADDIAVPAYVPADLPGVVCGYHLAIARPRAGAIDGRYLHWALASRFTREQFTVAATGVTRFGLRQDEIRAVKVPVPDLAAQRAIADYLDTETARINALITKKQRMIELLRERLRLAPEASLALLRDESELVALKFLVQESDQRRGGDVARVLLSVSIHHGVVPRSEASDKESRADDFTNYKTCEPGDIVINRMRAFQGAVGVVNSPGIVSPDYTVLRLGTRLEPDFVHYLMRSHWFIGEMASRIRGIGAVDQGQVRTPRVNFADLREIAVPVPPAEEQVRLVSGWRAQEAGVRAVVERLERQAELLREHRQALITAAVTGELEVPGVAA